MSIQDRIDESVRSGIMQVEYMNLTSLPPLPKKLKYLICSNNELQVLPELPNTLIALYCNNNKLTKLPDLPPNLLIMSCVNNQITELPKLPESLVHLECHHNQIEKLPYLPDSLVFLNCYNNKMETLPTLPENLNYFKNANNQFQQEIQTILNQFDDDLSAHITHVNNYLEQAYGLRRKQETAPKTARRKTEKKADAKTKQKKEEPQPSILSYTVKNEKKPRFAKTKKILYDIPTRLTRKIRGLRPL